MRDREKRDDEIYSRQKVKEIEIIKSLL
jgi:hypothetical protein